MALAALLAAATALAFAGVRHHEFVPWDDPLYVTENAGLERGLTPGGLAFAFSTVHVGIYVPVVWTSFLLDRELSGLSAGGVLLANVVYHTLAGLLLFAFLARTTGRPGPAAFAAGVFLLHPTRVESVAWATERKDVLCGLFWMATLCAYAWYTARPAAVRYGTVFVTTALALFSKPMAVTLPLVLLLLDVWPLARLSPTDVRQLGRRIVEKLPLVALAGAVAVVTYLTQRADGAVASLDALPLSARLANAVQAYAAYLATAVWPVDLHVFYAHAEHAAASTAARAGLLVALTAAALALGRRRPWLAVGWLWFVGTLVPVIGLVQVGMHARADRFLYLPLVGLAIAVAFGAAGLRRGRPLLPAAGIAALAAFSLLTVRQVDVWRDGVTLFSHAVALDPSNPHARGNLGIAYLYAGRRDAGVRELATALGLPPSHDDTPRAVFRSLAQTARGWRERDRPIFAIVHARAALGIRPDSAEVHELLAAALRDQGRDDEAAAHAERARRDRARGAPSILRR